MEATIRTAVLSHDAAKCTGVLTAALREEMSGKNGRNALRDCREEAVEDKHDTKAVAISHVDIEGDRATAEAAYSGGTFGGQTILLSLAERGGRWKVDQVVRIAKFDRRRFLAGAAVNIADSGEASPDQTRCTVARLGRESQGEIEAVMFHRSEAAEIELTRACPGGDYHRPDGVQISNAIHALVFGDEPSACLEFATQAYLEETTGDTGKEAIGACVQQQEQLPRPAGGNVSDVSVDGAEASAKVTVHNKAEGDEVYVMGLVREYGRWKVDGIDRLLSLDRVAFSRGVLEGFSESGLEVSPEVSACVLAKVRRMPLSRFEALLLPLDPQLSIRIFGPCAEAGGEAPAPS